MMLARLRLGWVPVLLCLTGFVHAGAALNDEQDDVDESQLLTGTLGDRPVVMSLSQDEGDEVYGRYFALADRRDVALEGTLKGTTLTLREGPESRTGRPLITLKATDEGWEGSWRDRQGTTRALRLITSAPPPAAGDDAWWQRLRERHPYDYLRMHDVALVADETQSFMGYSLQWLRDPISGLRMFQVVSGYPAERQAQINSLLRARLYNEVISYHECLVSDRFEGGEFEQQVEPKLLTASLLSADIFTSYDCGGAHPDFGSSPINLDVTRLRTLGLEDLLWIGSGKPFHFVDVDSRGERIDSGVSFDTFSDYRIRVFAPWLVATLSAAWPQEMDAPQEESECDYRSAAIWQFPGWYLTPQGIWFGPAFPRVLRACEGPSWSVVPWNIVRQHPGGLSLDLPTD